MCFSAIANWGESTMVSSRQWCRRRPTTTETVICPHTE